MCCCISYFYVSILYLYFPLDLTVLYNKDHPNSAPRKQLDGNYLCVIMEVGAAEDTAFVVESVAEKLAELVNTAADTETESDFDCDDRLFQNYF